ncbi:MAG: hypothetical protein A2Z11_04305 [Candidatus Woykebacteria bacterium RBG_16_43_9]|uniref:Uncharacterized protein n=1 Tax=Candidatus Woykebacteria bacterium RBG_16_43_9 TaxID=1802596 RepID=A0A1G1WGZ6_9BACT|nr:MAG: hypothetical protein A2Z11_04305 [Candidatus Woykebacteria bacterium RBG_16_43_9]
MIDLSKILSKNKNLWLALTPDNKKLVAKGVTLEEALEAARKKGVQDPTLLKSTSQDNFYAG